MGGGIAAALAERGASVNAYDADPTALERLLADAPGVHAASSPAAAVDGAAALLTVVPGPAELAAVADDLLNVDPGPVPYAWLQMSTVGPPQIAEIAARAAARGITVTDVGIVGSPPQASAGELTLLVGGLDEVAAPARSVLDAIGSVMACGGSGTGMTVKVLANLLGGAITTATGEALAIGRRLGVPDAVLVEGLMATGARNVHLQGPYAERALRGDLRPAFTTTLALKDVRLGLDLAEQLNLPVPTSAGAASALEHSSAAGYAEADVTALFAALVHGPATDA
jgi:4-hydroxybutyrate dehydrogenase / sulfolactaldehyde 3-reductase